MNLVLPPKLKYDLLDPVLRQRTGSSLGGDELKQVRIVLKRRWALIRSMAKSCGWKWIVSLIAMTFEFVICIT
jgi:hypothetical protein